MKIDIKYDDQSEIAIPMLSLCQQTMSLMRNSSLRNYNEIYGLLPAQLYNMTFSFKTIVINLIYNNGKSYPSIEELKDEEHQIKSIIR